MEPIPCVDIRSRFCLDSKIRKRVYKLDVFYVRNCKWIQYYENKRILYNLYF